MPHDASDIFRHMPIINSLLQTRNSELRVLKFCLLSWYCVREISQNSPHTVLFSRNLTCTLRVSNSTTKPATRCDYILARGDFKAVNASTVGGPRKILQTKQLVAPSDHYAVVATLSLEEVNDQCNDSSVSVGSERANVARTNNEL